MDKTDRFLVAIVIGIALLVVAAFVVVLLQPEPQYQAEDAPEGVVHNYLLALKREEYERAYSYLSPSLPGYPASEPDFYDGLLVGRVVHQLREGSIALSVASSRVTGDRAAVSVQQTTFHDGGLFDRSRSTSYFEVDLRREAGEWKIVMAERYWHRCWDAPDSNFCPPR